MPQLTKLLAAAVTAALATTTWADDGGERDFRLRPETDLTSGCFDFPVNNFDRKR